jgi:uncharacterized membrane protein
MNGRRPGGDAGAPPQHESAQPTPSDAAPVQSAPARPVTPAPAQELAQPAHVMAPIERMVSLVLRFGVGLAVAFMAVGLVLAAAGSAGLPAQTVPVRRLPALLLEFDAAAYLSIGLLVLIATPFVRVLGSIVAFAGERDRRYVAVTAVVLAVMLLSVALGRA